MKLAWKTLIEMNPTKGHLMNRLKNWFWNIIWIYVFALAIRGWIAIFQAFYELFKERRTR
jgi:hypothetical protein